MIFIARLIRPIYGSIKAREEGNFSTRHLLFSPFFLVLFPRFSRDFFSPAIWHFTPLGQKRGGKVTLYPLGREKTTLYPLGLKRGEKREFRRLWLRRSSKRATCANRNVRVPSVTPRVRWNAKALSNRDICMHVYAVRSRRRKKETSRNLARNNARGLFPLFSVSLIQPISAESGILSQLWHLSNIYRHLLIKYSSCMYIATFVSQVR